MCSSTSNAVTRSHAPERTGSWMASARMAAMPLARATSATESEYSTAAACHPCAFSTLVLPPPAAPMSRPRPGPGSRRSSRPSIARRSLYHQWRSSREVSSRSSAVSTASLLHHALRPCSLVAAAAASTSVVSRLVAVGPPGRNGSRRDTCRRLNQGEPGRRRSQHGDHRDKHEVSRRRENLRQREAEKQSRKQDPWLRTQPAGTCQQGQQYR